MKVVVSKCADCPFFTKSLISMLATKGSAFAGDCRAPGETKLHQITRAKSLPVTDNRIIQTWCPMRLGDIVTTIGASA